MVSNMSEEKQLMKISRAKFGIGGYNDAMLGVFFTFTGNSCGVGDDKSAWDCNLIKVTENTKWTEESRGRQYEDIMRYVSGLLKEAKVLNFDQLVGKPVEVTLEGNQLKSWRILTEVL